MPAETSVLRCSSFVGSVALPSVLLWVLATNMSMVLGSFVPARVSALVMTSVMAGGSALVTADIAETLKKIS